MTFLKSLNDYSGGMKDYVMKVCLYAIGLCYTLELYQTSVAPILKIGPQITEEEHGSTLCTLELTSDFTIISSRRT